MLWESKLKESTYTQSIFHKDDEVGNVKHMLDDQWEKNNVLT